VIDKHNVSWPDDILEMVEENFPEFLADSWRPWRNVLAATYGLEPEDPEFVRELTGREVLPTSQARRAMYLAGRRSGKSRISALIAAYHLCCREYADIAEGERTVFVLVASTKSQALSVKSYFLGLLRSRTCRLAVKVVSETQESVKLSNGLELVIMAGRQSIRGATIVGAVLDEAAFIRSLDDGAAMSDEEIIRAIEPGMGTVADPLMVIISSPHRKKGLLWKLWNRFFGKSDARTLVIKAPTKLMNPQFDQEVIDEAYADDPVSAATEYSAEWRDDSSDFVSADKLDAATDSGVEQRPRAEGVTYRAFADPAGGTGTDSFVVAIAHEENKVQVLDVVAGVEPPFSPAEVIKGCAALLKSYGVYDVTTDRYSGGFAPEQWRLNGIEWKPSEKSRSELYLAFVPMLNSGGCRLVDDDKMRAQLLALRRKVAPGGRESVDHPVGGNDDYANAAAGALVLNAGERYRVRSLAS
jgi:hypothetical protein